MPETADGPMFKVEHCSTCGRPIIWAVTERARTMPVDAEPPTTGGSVQLEWRGAGVSPLARVLPVAKQFGKTGLRLSHFVTCPDAAKHRRGKGGSR